MPLSAGIKRRLRLLRPVVRWVRRVVRRVVRAGQRPLGVLVRVTRRLPLPSWLLVPFAHEATDTVALERLIERTVGADGGSPPRGRARLLRVAMLRRGRLALDARDHADALGWFERLHETLGPSAEAWTWRAVTLRRLGRLDESLDAGRAAVELDESWCPALAHLGMLNIQLNRTREAVEWLGRLLDAPDASISELTWAWRGLDRIGEHERGLDVVDRMVADARHGDAWPEALRAVSLHQLGDHEQAARIETLLSARTDHESLRACAFLLARTGRAGRARDVIEGLPPARRDGLLLTDIVLALHDEGHLFAAAELVERSVADHPGDTDLEVTRRVIVGMVPVFDGSWLARQYAAHPDVVDAPEQRCDVLHVVGRTAPYASSGYAVRTDHTVRAQRALGIDAHVVSQIGFPWLEGHGAESLEDVNGVPHHRLRHPNDLKLPPALDAQLDANVDALSALVERLRPSVLHAASDFRNGLLALVVGERFDVPVVYEARGFWEETWLAKRAPSAIDTDVYRLRRERENEVARRAAHVFTLAPTMLDALIERGVPGERISLAPNAVDPDAFPFLPRDTQLAARLGIDDDEVVVGYVSSFVGYEGIDVLIEAIARVRDSGVPVRGLLVGDGPVRRDLERLTERLDLDGQVIFAGRVPHVEVASYYSVIDVFVVPRTDARVCRLVSPLKPFEAMATGRAMIVSGTPVLSDIVDHGRIGRVFEPMNPDDLAARIIELATDADLRAELAGAAREHVLEHHTWRRNAERYRAVYAALGAAQPDSNY